MRRPSKRPKIAERGKEPRTVLRLKDKLQIFGVFGFFLFALVGGIFLHRAKHHVPFEKKYHLDAAQMQQVNALEAEHNRIYPQLKRKAEERRQQFETLSAAEGPTSPSAVTLLAETNTLREALWTEELRYCRGIAELMTPEYSALYLAPVEKKFANRKPDSTGFLKIPHP